MRFASIALCLALTLAACSGDKPQPEDLPWQLTLNAQGQPTVFHIAIGQDTLKSVIDRFHHFPEIALFTQQNGKQSLEAYFAKQRLGLFEAKLLVDLQADDATLNQLQQKSGKREGTASGQWKYALDEKDLPQINQLLIRRVVYMPSVDYTPDVVKARFGEPGEVLPSSQTRVEYWFYPDKGLAILLNNDGGDIFYYTAREHYAVLRQELVESKPTND